MWFENFLLRCWWGLRELFGHKCARPGLAGDKALCLKLFVGLNNGDASDAAAGGQFPAGRKFCAWRKISVEDQLAKLKIDLAVEGIMTYGSQLEQLKTLPGMSR